jgi:hypothetical protein
MMVENNSSQTKSSYEVVAFETSGSIQEQNHHLLLQATI